MKKYLLLFLASATMINSAFSQKIEIDTSRWEDESTITWRSEEDIIEQKDFKDEILISHFKQIDADFYSYQTYYENGELRSTSTSQKIKIEQSETEFSFDRVNVGEYIEFTENGDTILYNVYPKPFEMQVYDDYGEIFPLKTVYFEYYNNQQLKNRSSFSRIVKKDIEVSEQMAPLGWQRDYYENGKLEREEYFVIPKGKDQENVAQNISGERTFSVITNTFSKNGQLTDSIRISKSKIFGKGFYDNGEPSYIGKSTLDYYVNNDEYEDVKWFDENGIYTLESEKGLQEYKGKVLVYDEERNKNGDIKSIKTYWNSGNKKSAVSKTTIHHFSQKGELIYIEQFDDYDRQKHGKEKINFFTEFSSSNLIEFYALSKSTKKCSIGESFDKNKILAYPLSELDTAFFVNSKLYSSKKYRYTKDSVLYLVDSENHITGESYNCKIWYTDTSITRTKKHPNGFEEKQRHENSQLIEKTTLLDVIDSNLVYEHCYYWDKERYEYRNYYDSVFYKVGPLYSYIDNQNDSIVSKGYPAMNESIGQGGYKSWHFNHAGERTRCSETFVPGEIDSTINIEYIDSIFYNDCLIKTRVQYEDSMVTSLFTLQGIKYSHSTIQSENGYNNGAVSTFNFSIFDRTKSKGERVRQIIPYAAGQTGNYESIIYTVDSTYALIGSSYIIETESNKIIYQDPLNLKFEKASWSHLIKYKSHLYLLTNNSIYDFENDRNHEIANLEKTLAIDYNSAYFYDGDDPYIKRTSLESIIEKHRLIVLDSIEYKPISNWNEYYLYNESKLVEVTDNYRHEIKTIDLKTGQSNYVSFDELGIKSFQRIGDIFYQYDSKKNEKIKAGFYIDTITYFDINDSIITTWALQKRIEYKKGEIQSYPLKDGVLKSTRREISNVDLENEILIGFTTYDQYDDYTSCCPESVNGRDFENIKIDFKNEKITSLKSPKNYSSYNMVDSPSAMELFLSEVKSTDEIFYSSEKKKEIAKFKLQSDKDAIILDLENGKIITDKEAEVFDENYWKVDARNQKVNISDQDKETVMHFIDATYSIDTSRISDLFFSNDLIESERKMFSVNKGYMRIFWNGGQKQINNRLVAISFFDDKPIFYTPDKYYMSSYGAEEYLHFQKGLRTYSFEQFDLKYNRPDIILDRLGYADQALIDAYHKAYQKRLKKMGFTEDMLKDDFHLPEIKIENFEAMPTLHDQGSIDIKLNIKDTKYKLDRINVWVNDVAVYGVNGISLRDKNLQEYNTTLALNLAKGDNKVQLSVLNQAGAESYKETFEINCTAGKDKADLYLITIGESEFKQSDYNLNYAAKDANDVASLFSKSKVFENVFTKTLVNQEVTKESITALSSFLEKADINDQVMIFIAGHGVLDANLDYFFATYDMDFQHPQERGLAYEDLEGLLDGIKPLKKILFIDACHSGEIDKDEVDLAIAETTEGGDIQFRAVGNTATPKLGIQNTSELTKSLFTDLRKGTGATVISSAGGMEFAMEGDDWNNGLFTYCLINGINTKEADYDNNGEIWLSELQKYVSEQVTLLSNGLQQPTSRIENQIVDFRVW